MCYSVQIKESTGALVFWAVKYGNTYIDSGYEETHFDALKMAYEKLSTIMKTRDKSYHMTKD